MMCESNHIIVLVHVMLDQENVWVSVEVSSLSSILAEIYVITYPLPVNGDHL